MKTLLRRAARLVLGRRSWLPAAKRAIVVYHDISAPGAPQHSPHYSTRPEVFRRHLDVLQRNFHLVALDEIVAPGPAGPAGRGAKPRVAITFDDGFATVREKAEPFLAERGIPFALFVNAQAVSEGRLSYLSDFSPPPQPPGARFYLGASDIDALARKGVLIGNHSASHRALARCTDGELDEEIVAGKEYLDALLGHPVRHFAIPYGKRQHYDDRAVARCFASGHSHVYSTNPVLFDAKSLAVSSRRPLPRIGLTNETVEELLFLLNRPLFQRIEI